MRTRDEMAGAMSMVALGLAGAIALGLALPNVFLMPAIAQLMPYTALAMAPVALALLLLRRWGRAILTVLFAAAVLALTWWRFESVAAPSPEPGAGGEVFTLVSFNALHSNLDAPSVVPFILRSDADAVLFLEADELRNSIPDLSQRFPYRMGCAGREKCDTVLLSRFPPTVAWKASLGAVPAERYVQFGINFAGRAVTLVGSHLTKPYFDDLALIELGVLTERVNRLTGPVILAGDFNSAPWSPALRRFSNDTSLRFSGRFVGTWPEWAGSLGLPIDHVLTREAEILSLEPLPEGFGSNHRGLLARIRIP